MHPDLKIKIPRGKNAPLFGTTAAEYWDLVRKHGTSRKAMVNFICGIGGYSDRGERWAIEWSIKAHSADVSVENLWKLVCSPDFEEGPESTTPPEHLAQIKALFWRVYEEHKDHVWDWAIEEAYEGWRYSDTPYETWLGERIDWSWTIRGRCGGHLCMTECGIINLRCSTEDLRERLMEKAEPGGGLYSEPWEYPHACVRKLFILCVQNTVEFTSEKISEEVERCAAWRLWSFCEDEVKNVIALYEQRERLSEDARHILLRLSENDQDNLTGAFETICQLADVKIGD